MRSSYTARGFGELGSWLSHGLRNLADGRVEILAEGPKDRSHGALEPKSETNWVGGSPILGFQGEAKRTGAPKPFRGSPKNRHRTKKQYVAKNMYPVDMKEALEGMEGHSPQDLKTISFACH